MAQAKTKKTVEPTDEQRFGKPRSSIRQILVGGLLAEARRRGHPVDHWRVLTEDCSVEKFAQLVALVNSW